MRYLEPAQADVRRKAINPPALGHVYPVRGLTSWGTRKDFRYTFLLALKCPTRLAWRTFDPYSQLWDGNMPKNQTARMRAFLGRFLPRDATADAIAIQLWRHTLMHTSRPRRLRDRVTGQEYSYLLYWGSPELPADEHYRIVDGNKLDFGLEHFLKDLQRLLAAYLSALDKSPDLQAKATATWQTIVTQEFET